MAQKIGEWSDTKDATEETQEICDQVKGQVEQMTGQNYGVYTAVKYRIKQLMGGAFFLFKVHVGGENYDHLSVNQILGTEFPCPPTLRGVEQHKTKDAPLVPFPN